jgi:hypothetical protein
MDEKIILFATNRNERKSVKKKLSKLPKQPSGDHSPHREEG